MTGKSPTITKEEIKFQKSLVDSASLLIHTHWCSWHEEVPVYDKSYPGDILSIDDLRAEFLGKQGHNDYATDLISRASNMELMAVVRQFEAETLSKLDLVINFNWVAYHEGQRDYFRQALSNRDFDGIRNNYHGHQGHNPNARGLLCSVSNSLIERLVNNI